MLTNFCLSSLFIEKECSVNENKIIKIKCLFSFSTDGGLGAGTITSRWPPVAGPLGPADTNGSGVDGKHLDVGDMSDVSDVSIIFLNFN
jgi:hypothetical protein